MLFFSTHRPRYKFEILSILTRYVPRVREEASDIWPRLFPSLTQRELVAVATYQSKVDKHGLPHAVDLDDALTLHTTGYRPRPLLRHGVPDDS